MLCVILFLTPQSCTTLCLRVRVLWLPHVNVCACEKAEIENHIKSNLLDYVQYSHLATYFLFTTSIYQHFIYTLLFAFLRLEDSCKYIIIYAFQKKLQLSIADDFEITFAEDAPTPLRYNDNKETKMEKNQEPNCVSFIGAHFYKSIVITFKCKKFNHILLSNLKKLSWLLFKF